MGIKLSVPSADLFARDTANRNRANHTGTQPWNTITGTPTTTAGYGITDAAFNGQIINGVAHFVQNTAPTTRIDEAGQNIGALVAGDKWYKPTDNGITGTAGNWIWTGSDWASVNVFPLSIPVENGFSSNQTIRSESVGTNLGIRVSGLASQIAVLNANPTSANYWTAAISISGTPVTTLSTQNAVSYPHNYSTPNTVIPARASIPVGETLTVFALGQTTRNWVGMTTLGTDVYASVSNGDIYKQTNGVGNFLPLGQTTRNWVGITTLGTDVYACVFGGDIYKQANGSGNFIALSQTTRSWRGMTTLGTDVYACVNGGDIYKQTNGAGDFLPLGQTTRNWVGMTTLGMDVYACVYGGGDIYKQTNGVGNFLPLGQTTRNWAGMTTLGTDVYASVDGGDIYKQTGGTGNFIALGQTSRAWRGMTTLGTDVYACVEGGDIYLLNALNAGVVTSIGHSLEVTLTRTGAVSLLYASITANCQVIHP